MSIENACCPFCLSNGTTVESERAFFGWWAWVACIECGARGPRKINRDPDEAEKEASAAWNDGCKTSTGQ